ncbi:dienelactone hydrolase family protein [Methanosarcina acetivorans]|uniref:Dienelactone hydrolase family protein n=1 Tax=Methanosarcina acetivorans (strain ATCC 35395 / DSM 2834 / JCM 12185 / C2A) TaxID=188937 RepID=Q8TQH2_METAC|nr:dienelactone hydrolase family protein [Methanosarcina acetivorans]AAM04984.1 dienelactone hydrolase family protein [Methanosarcina acetivorans C2A]
MKFMKTLLLLLLIVCLIGVSGCTSSEDSEPDVPVPDTPEPSPDVPAVPRAAGNTSTDILNETVNITGESLEYPSYTAAPAVEGEYPAVVLIHSFNGFEPGYQEMVDRMAADGFVVVAPQWQTYSRSPPDSEVEALVRNSVSYLESRDDVDPEKIGLTGFCAGGRYTMLFLPQIEEFNSGVAWYGFPYSGGTETQPEAPANLTDQLEAPILIIHGTRDQASNVSDIYRYAGELDAADKYFELKVYQGEPHGFMVQDGELSESFVAQDAYDEMINFFDRTLNSGTMNNSSQ